MDRIREGVRRFQREVFPQKRALYEDLAASQAPTTLFITCGDSRIDPEMLTQSGPGEIFVERNPGNIVPVYDSSAKAGVSASIEYAVSVLKIQHIIICGHSDCGAMKGILSGEKLRDLPSVARWLKYSQAAVEQLSRMAADLSLETRLEKLIELNVIAQMENLKTHPCVANSTRIVIEGWTYEIHSGEVLAYNALRHAFEPLS